MKLSGIVALMIVGVALVLAGCGGQASEAPSDPTYQEHTVTNEEPSILHLLPMVYAAWWKWSIPPKRLLSHALAE